MLMLRGGESQDGYGAETDEPPRKEDRNADPDVRTVTGDWLDLSGQDHLSTTVKSIGVRELICMFLVSFKRSWIFPRWYRELAADGIQESGRRLQVKVQVKA